MIDSDEARRRRSQVLLWGGLNALLVVSIAVMLNYLAFRHYRRWDWTAHDIYTLSPRTKAVLDDLRRPVNIWIFLSQGEAGYEELRNLLERYRAESSRIQIRYVDPDRSPDEFRRLVARFGIGASVTQQGEARPDVAAVVASGERHWEITRDDLLERGEPTDDEEGEVTVSVETERALTGALVELTTGRATKVCVTAGHGEATPETGLEGFVRAMDRENLDFSSVATRGLSSIPRDCNAVFVISPTVAFNEQEAELLRDYLRGGGNLLVALDPVLDEERHAFVPLGLETMLNDFGVSVDRSIVVEPNEAAWPAGSDSPTGPFLVADWGEHAITEPFASQQLPLVLLQARSVRPSDEERVHVLARASAQSFAVTDLRTLMEGRSLTPNADDVRGPVSIAVATEVELARGGDDEHRTGGRLVVVGAATILETNLLADERAVNRAFASAVLGWLTHRRALIAIEPRTYRHRAVMISAEHVVDIYKRVALYIPLAFVLLGFAVWWNRRQ